MFRSQSFGSELRMFSSLSISQVKRIDCLLSYRVESGSVWLSRDLLSWSRRSFYLTNRCRRWISICASRFAVN